MRIGNLAKLLGISADWVRRLERAGRIPPASRDLNGHRRFTPEDVEHLREILYHRGDPGVMAPPRAVQSVKGKR